MSPADIPAAAFREGLSRRLAELGLVPPDPAIYRATALPVPPVPSAARRDRVVHAPVPRAPDTADQAA
jgi:hypothetical protein